MRESFDRRILCVYQGINKTKEIEMITKAFDKGYEAGRHSEANDIAMPANPYRQMKQMTAWRTGYHHGVCSVARECGYDNPRRA